MLNAREYGAEGSDEQIIKELIDNAFESDQVQGAQLSYYFMKDVHKVQHKELGLCNVEVSITNNELRLWACDPKKGVSVFRIKALGKVLSNDSGAVITQ